MWDEATLDRWLAAPEALVPGTSMTFLGVKDAQQRLDVIAYLHALAEGNAPQNAQARGGMRGMGGQRADLKTAPPEGQVKAVSHCGDTYTIDTADGTAQKIWEFNLRIKTDSSNLGPLPGQPVVIGSGMRCCAPAQRALNRSSHSSADRNASAPSPARRPEQRRQPLRVLRG